MAAEGTKVDWSSLTELLEKAVKELAARRPEPAQAALAEFIRRGQEVGCGALCQAVEAQAEFLQRYVLPRWDDEAAATLDFSMGALLEKMQLESPGAQFNAGLNEIVSFLEQFEDDLEGAPAVDVAAQGQDALGERASVSGEPPEMDAILGGPERDESLMGSGAGNEDVPDGLPHVTGGSGIVDVDLPPEAGSSDYVIDRVDWCREVLREDPSSVLFCELAEDLCARGLWQDAIRALREGLYHHPRHIRGHALLGWALWEFGSAEQAEKVLNQVRNEIEKSALAYRVLGEIATHLGDMEEAGRFDTIYSLMRKGMDEPETQWVPASISPAEDIGMVGAQAVAEPAPEPVQEPRGARLLNFLEALRNRISVESAAKAASVTVFTADDREVLEKLIHVQAGHL